MNSYSEYKYTNIEYLYSHMNSADSMMDWALLQSFEAVGEHGSLSAAARATGTSQPTLSRHISTLEQQTGARLFDRKPGGLTLTSKGVALLAHAREMSEAASRFSLAAGHEAGPLAGTVRITASQIMATFILPDILTSARQQEPGIDLELIASDQTDNLLRREADIAVRMYRPSQPDVIARKVGELKLGMYAARSYLDRAGMPETVAAITDHDIIGYDRNTQIIDGFRQAGITVNRESFAFRCDDQPVCWQMVLAGYGIGFNQIRLGDADPRVRRIDLAGTVGSLPVWLTAHAELKTSARVRAIYDILSDDLAATCT